MSGYSRRRLLGAGASGGGTLLAGGYAWNRYRRRDHLRFRPLEAVNESTAVVTLEFVVDGNGIEAERTVRLEPAGGDARSRLPGRWTETPTTWTVRAEYGEEVLEIGASAITERLADANWGADCAHVTIAVTAIGELDARIRSC
ncbi:hypothetical protein GWG54_07770 [Natronococcus sp. JC468]|uniref:hypothetical protein n=1 Tax=Natronococcus sp. JC468 TaxID=1961921 RepID=UPI00143A74D2|nr:hypothetical protein [Natronococcus sp. JC468]NKE35717.1 hypothetical protein [Natronococcus sp. JC468]